MSYGMIGVIALSMLGMFFVLLYMVLAVGNAVADHAVEYHTEKRRKERQRKRADFIKEEQRNPTGNGGGGGAIVA